MKQTAVEWLAEQIKKFHNWKLNTIYDENCFDEIELHKSINQAKEMEKQQIIDFAIEFAEWIRIKDFQTTSKDNWIALDYEYYTTKELLEQFKNK